MESLATRAIRDIRDRHADFQALGRGGRSRHDFPFEATMAPEFVVVTTEGGRLTRAELMAHFDRMAEGVGDDFAIAVDDFAVVHEGVDAVLVEYTETQWKRGARTRRRSTALFVPDAAAPNGVVWRHLQETWIAVP